MYWQSHDEDGRPINGGTVPDVGVTPEAFRAWLEGKGHTNVTITPDPPTGPAGDARRPGPDGATGENPADAAERRRPGAGAPPGGNGCTATEFSTAHAFAYDPGMDSDRARLEWEMCGRAASDDIHDLTDLEELAAHAGPTRRRTAVPPPGAEDNRTPGQKFADDYESLTPEQRALYDAVDKRAGYDGADARDVLDRMAGSPKDKAAVADMFGGAGAGDRYRDRDQRMADRAAERAEVARQYREGTIDYGQYLDRMGEFRSADDAENTLDVQDRVAAAYEELAGEPGDVVGIDKLRDKVNDVPKAVFDHAVQQLAAHPDAGLEPGGADNFYTGPTEAERLAAVNFGGERGVRFRMGENFDGNNPPAIARRFDEDGRPRPEADSIVRRFDDDAVADIAERLGVDTSDNPPPEIVRERVAEHAGAVHARRHHEAVQFHADAHALAEAERDLDNIREWEPERRAAVREAADRQSGTGTAYVDDRAQKVGPAVREADLVDTLDAYSDYSHEAEAAASTDRAVDAVRDRTEAARAAAAAADRMFGPGMPLSGDTDGCLARYRDAARAGRDADPEEFDDAAWLLAEYLTSRDLRGEGYITRT